MNGRQHLRTKGQYSPGVKSLFDADFDADFNEGLCPSLAVGRLFYLTVPHGLHKIVYLVIVRLLRGLSEFIYLTLRTVPVLCKCKC